MSDNRDRDAAVAGGGRVENPIGLSADTQTYSTRSRVNSAREASPFLTTKEAAFYLGLAVVTLKGMRRRDTGPKCRKHGRDWRYHIDELEAWSLANSAGGDHG